MTRSLSGHFVASVRGRIFLVLREPATYRHNQPSCVLVVPPFGEELNRSRELITDFSVGLLDAGLATAVLDLYGTGDSDGLLDQADWGTWRSDVVTAVDWLAAENLIVVGLLAIRMGCALAAECAKELNLRLRSSVFWEPVPSGRQTIDATLRLRTAASLLEGRQTETVKALRKRLDRGESIEAGGYCLSPNLVRSMDAVELATIDTVPLGPLAWIQLVRNEASVSQCDSVLPDSGEHNPSITPIRIVGAPFWTIAEPTENPELVEASVNWFTSSHDRAT